MIIKKINGVDTIFLEDGEKINISSDSDLKTSETICIQNLNKNLFFQDMDKTTFVPYSKNYNDTVNKLETWLNLFKEFHDLAKQTVLSSYGKDNSLSLLINFYSYYKDYVYCNGISLDITRNINRDYLTQAGIYINTQYQNMYKYLLTDALSYIIQKDYMHWKEFLALYQPHISGIKNNQPIVINFNSLLSKSNYEQIFKRLLMAHHLEKEDKDLQRIMKRDTKLEEVPNDFMDIYIRNAQENLTQLKRVYKNI